MFLSLLRRTLREKGNSCNINKHNRKIRARTESTCRGDRKGRPRGEKAGVVLHSGPGSQLYTEFLQLHAWIWAPNGAHSESLAPRSSRRRRCISTRRTSLHSTSLQYCVHMQARPAPHTLTCSLTLRRCSNRHNTNRIAVVSPTNSH